MKKRFDVLYPRSYRTANDSPNDPPKTQWLRCGVAFQSEQGHIDVISYMMPAATPQKDGSYAYKLQLREPDGREGGADQNRGGGQQRGPQVERRNPRREPGDDDDGSDLPF